MDQTSASTESQQSTAPTLQIVTYPHPSLRQVAKPIRRVDAELRRVVREMFDLMYASKGIGLAATQVDIPLRFFILNLEARPDAGQEMVFINPVTSFPKGPEEAEEGCLSLPGLYGPVVRPAKVRVNAYGIDGHEIQGDLTGLMARCVQHELDHLDGVLFPDRMSATARADIKDELDLFETEFESKRTTGAIASDEELAKKWAEWEARYA